MGKKRSEMTYKDLMLAYQMVRTKIQKTNIQKWHQYHVEELQKINREKKFYEGISYDDIQKNLDYLASKEEKREKPLVNLNYNDSIDFMELSEELDQPLNQINIVNLKKRNENYSNKKTGSQMSNRSDKQIIF